MLIVALVLAVIGLAALVTAVVTSNELIAWVCIAASVIGVVLLIVDAIRDRSRSNVDEEYPDQSEAPEEPSGDEADYDAETTVVEQADDLGSDERNR
jgi:hypothetical protein